MSQNIGAFWIFANFEPWQVLAMVFFITHVGYWIFVNLTEGPAQTLNVSASGYVGYFGLLFHDAVIFCALAVGRCLSSGTIVPRGRPSDGYHSWIVVPTLVYFVFFAVWAIVGGGTSEEQFIAGVLVGLSIVLVLFDYNVGRMDQPTWRRDHGVVLPTKRTPG